MTSPTTSADAVKVLQGIRDVIAKADIMCLGAAGDSDGRAWPVRDEVVHDLTKAIATLTQHAEAGAVAFDDWPEFHDQGMGCGLEDRGITDRYEAMRYGWDEALDAVAERIKNHEAAPTTPPAAAQEDGRADTERLDWLDRQGVAYGFEDMHEGNRWCIDGAYATVRLAIDAAMLTSPDSGKEGV